MSRNVKPSNKNRAAIFSLCLLCAATAGCIQEGPAGEDGEQADIGSFQEALGIDESPGGVILDIQREVMSGHLAHYTVLLKVGESPNARLRIHRIVREKGPWSPRRTAHAVMLLHGDFATFTTNFALSLASDAVAPGHDLAVYLAKQGIDVWGVDRRWTMAAAEGPDLSDFPDMGFGMAIADTERALRFARAVRGSQGNGDKMFLGGFSRGGHIAYATAAEEAHKPDHRRNVKGLVPLDIYAAIAPEDDALRQAACARRDEERAMLDAGQADSDNTFFSLLGSLATAAPDDPSPFFDGLSNRGALLTVVGQTYLFYEPKPVYHLAAGVLSAEGAVTALRYSAEATVAAWLTAAAPHQALAEIADSDALWCGEGSLPPGSGLADIEVPVFYLGAAGGFGDHGLYTTSLLGSEEVSTLVVRRLDPAREAEDFGHADLLYAERAPGLAWAPLAAWILDN